MQSGNQLDTAQAPFNWTGLLVLLVSINASIGSLTTLYWIVLPAAVVSLIAFRHHLNLKNALIALSLTITVFHPVRLLFDWWLNPVLYGVITLALLLVLLRVSKPGRWKNYTTALLLVCMLLSGKETFAGISEVGTCRLEDVRYNQHLYCGSSARGYQQIASLPIGMVGWCYYCFWY
jgi:hypothetical protein